MQLHILSIDDSKAVLKYIEWVFSKSIHSVETFLSGRDALANILKNTTKYDLILLDWEMPDLDGIGVLEELKKENIKIPVAMLTSKNNEEDIKKAIEYGVEEFIMKPFTPELLLEKIEEICE